MSDSFAITVQELSNMKAANQPHTLLDVRGEDERQICVISDDVHIPMPDISMRYQELDDAKPIIVYCHSGIRSGQVARFLQSVGLKNVKNLQGGIDAWAEGIEPEMTRY